MQKNNNKEDEGRRWRRRDEEDEQEEEEEEEVMRKMKKKKMQKKKKKKEMKMKKKKTEEEEEEDDDVEEEEDELRGRWEAMRSRSFHYQCTRRSCSKNTEHSETIQQLAALRSFFFYLGALPPALKNKHSYKLPEKQKLWLTSNLLGSNRPF